MKKTADTALKSIAVAVGFSALTFFASAAPSPAAGGTLFKAKCVACHGANGSGETPMGKNLKIRDLRSAEVQKQTDLELTKVIAGGKGKMPPYGKQYSTPQIQDIIAFIRTLK